MMETNIYVAPESLYQRYNDSRARERKREGGGGRGIKIVQVPVIQLPASVSPNLTYHQHHCRPTVLIIEGRAIT
jgi:hypothetical protein